MIRTEIPKPRRLRSVSLLPLLVAFAGCTVETLTEDAGTDDAPPSEDATPPTPPHWGHGNDAGTHTTACAPDANPPEANPPDAASQMTFDGGNGVCAEPHFDPAELELFATLSPLPDVPPDPTNAYADNPLAAAFGQKLFFETAYSGPLKVASDLGDVGEKGKLACYTCHSGPYLDDQRSLPKNVSLGADFHTRNAPTTINSAFYRWTNWGGRFSAAWELPLPVTESPVIMNSSRLRLAHVIFEKYRAEYDALFEPDLDPAIGMDLARFPAEGKPKPAPTVLVPNPPDGAWEGMTAEDRAVINRIFVNFGKAIAAYMRLLVSRNAPFDQFVAGDESAIDCAAKRGLELFVGKARCVTCHLGPHFSDDAFHNLGVPQVGPHVPVSDDGRFKDIPPLLASPFSSATPYSDDVTTGRLLGLTNPPSPLTLSQFRTPDLRGVALTAPYMHSGQFDTLEQVIEFYDNGGGAPVSGSLDPLLVPLHLTDVEKSDLVAFLRTLTGDSVDPTLAHPVDAGSNPYP